MRAKIIAVLSEKGGPGKTSTSTNVSSCLKVRHGLKVLLVDYDPQGSASSWAASRDKGENDPGIIPVVSIGANLARDLPAIAGGYDVVVIDGKPALDALMTAALKVADLVVIPVQPSPYDIWATEPTINLIKERQELAEGRPLAAILVSQAIPGTRLAGEIRAHLKSYDLPVLDAQTCKRQAYIKGVAAGESVMDLPANDPARQEIEAVTTEILALLEAQQ